MGAGRGWPTGRLRPVDLGARSGEDTRGPPSLFTFPFLSVLARRLWAGPRRRSNFAVRVNSQDGRKAQYAHGAANPTAGR